LTLENVVGTIRSFLTEPLWDGCFMAGVSANSQFSNDAEVVEKKRQAITDRRAAFDRDESVAEFLTRICGGDERPVRNIVSGMLHGIYGGDVFKLSAKHTLFDRIWLQSVFPQHTGFMWVGKKEFYLQYDIVDGPNGLQVIEFAEQAKKHNLIAFDDGLITLVDALVKDLEGRENVTIKYDSPVTALEHKDDQVLVSRISVGNSPNTRLTVATGVKQRWRGIILRPSFKHTLLGSPCPDNAAC
jgi:oxygen-dependent protoporphyrinogen oxidase